MTDTSVNVCGESLDPINDDDCIDETDALDRGECDGVGGQWDSEFDDDDEVDEFCCFKFGCFFISFGVDDSEENIELIVL